MGQQEGKHVVKASGTDRDIEVILEPISVQTTRMRVTFAPSKNTSAARMALQIIAVVMPISLVDKG